MSVADATLEARELTRAQLIWSGVVLWLCFAIVGGSAAFSSFRHIVEVSLLAHQDEWVSRAMPFAIDGSMVIATVAMYRDRVTGRYPRGWALFVLWFGAILSLAANMASLVAVHGWEWFAMAWAGLPPLLLMFSIEVVSKPGRAREFAHLAVKAVDQVSAVVGEVRRMTGHARDQAVTAEPTPAGPTVTAENASPAEVAPSSPAPLPRPAEGGRAGRARVEDDGPLPQQLVDAALRIARKAWAEQHRVITRDDLRKALDQPDSGWTGGMAHTTYTRLLPLIREDLGATNGKPNR